MFPKKQSNQSTTQTHGLQRMAQWSNTSGEWIGIGGGDVHRPAVKLDLASGTFLHVGTAQATGAAQAGIGHCCEAVGSWDLEKTFSL